jgi:hypothetical protein
VLWAGADISVVRHAAEVLQARGVQLSQLRHPFLERTVLHVLCTLDFFWWVPLDALISRWRLQGMSRHARSVMLVSIRSERG